MSINREIYRGLCRSEPSIPLFSRDWWLDAVCGKDNWDVALEMRGDEVIGSLPFYRTRILGSSAITMPWLTQTMGPWVKPTTSNKLHKKVSHEMDITTSLIDKLPPFGYFEQRLDHTQTNWLPFYWKGFEQTTRYSHVIHDLTDLDRLWQECFHGIRKRIKKAQSQVEVIESGDVKRLFELHSAVFERQGIKLPYSLDLIERIDRACREHGTGRLTLAVDGSGEVHSADYMIWTEDKAIGLMSGLNPKYRNDESYKLLTWDAIGFASTVAKKYDFGGSMLMRVEELNRSFGGVQVPYSDVTKVNAPHLLLMRSLKQLVKWGQDGLDAQARPKCEAEDSAAPSTLTTVEE